MRRTSLFPPRLRGSLVLVAILAALLGLARSAAASADIEVRRHGSSWARVEDDGTVRVEGRLAGRIEEDGSVRVNGHLEGSVGDDGTIRAAGRLAGKVEKDGTLRSEGKLLGRVEGDGTIRQKGGLWGNASPCCPSYRELRRVAALLFFFDRGFFGP